MANQTDNNEIIETIESLLNGIVKMPNLYHDRGDNYLKEVPTLEIDDDSKRINIPIWDGETALKDALEETPILDGDVTDNNGTVAHYTATPIKIDGHGVTFLIEWGELEY